MSFLETDSCYAMTYAIYIRVNLRLNYLCYASFNNCMRLYCVGAMNFVDFDAVPISRFAESK